ncbi:MAG: tocopherol cyclase family protein [Fidelibacterota bacterium]|jgi:tocopherol cyclase|tara:strand:+ start:2860 stop:3831 length:972 start_codon:yes stop_codon:yes gene_type:complete
MFIKKPEQYHGKSNKNPFFEGWYHKITTVHGKSIVIIPGIYRSGLIDYETAFLMIYNGENGKVDYLTYSTDEFICDPNKYELKLGNNTFSLNEIKLNINTSVIKVKGHVKNQNIKPWPVTILEPGCMGWYAYVPTMECFHGILSMDHILEGKIKINNQSYLFDNGRGYIEKDWGKNFPKNWVWAQSNDFEVPGISLSVSLATIPWRKSEFSGFIVGLQVNNALYRFTPYKGCKVISVEYNEGKFSCHFKQDDLELQIELYKGLKTGILFAPDKFNMEEKVSEYLDAKIKFKLKKRSEVIVEGESLNSALEIIGDTKSLISNFK